LSSEIEMARANRFRFLKLLYDKSGGDEMKWFSMWKIGEELGLDHDDAVKIVQYLTGEYLIESRGLGGIIGITHQDVVTMEEALSNPSQSTKYFPPVDKIKKDKDEETI